MVWSYCQADLLFLKTHMDRRVNYSCLRLRGGTLRPLLETWETCSRCDKLPSFSPELSEPGTEPCVTRPLLQICRRSARNCRRRATWCGVAALSKSEKEAHVERHSTLPMRHLQVLLYVIRRRKPSSSHYALALCSQILICKFSMWSLWNLSTLTFDEYSASNILVRCLWQMSFKRKLGLSWNLQFASVITEPRDKHVWVTAI